jgi:glutamine amidotransferase
MCELFAMSARYPSTVEMSLEEFSRHGGLSGAHKDGWGIAWYDEGDLRLIKETAPAASSACVQFVQAHPLRSTMVISHIRKATQGQVATRNCQPFVRELGGAWHSFAHNGDLRGWVDEDPERWRSFRPVGETDSERAFCALLEGMLPLWRGAGTPELSARLEIVAQFAAELRAKGPANFLYCDGDAMFAHAHRRSQSDGTIRAPGLWRLARHCDAGGELQAEGLRIVGRESGQDVVLFASVPLTAEDWLPMAEGEVLAARLGRVDIPGR